MNKYDRWRSGPECDDCGGYNYQTDLCPLHMTIHGLRVAFGLEEHESFGWFSEYDKEEIQKAVAEIVKEKLVGTETEI
jgi:hypothetical protein